jgi:FlaA1/EpsC-like NDP-sugar epimerase
MSAFMSPSAIEPGLSHSLDATSVSSRPRWSRQVAADLVGLADAFAIELGAILPALIYQANGNVAVNWSQVLQTGILSTFIVVCCLRSWGLYATSKMHQFPIEPLKLFSAIVIALAAVHGVGMPFAPGAMHAWVWYAVWLSASFSLILWTRIMAQLLLGQLTAAGRFDVRIAVFGAGVIARRVHDHLIDPVLGITFAGVYDDRRGDQWPP